MKTTRMLALLIVTFLLLGTLLFTVSAETEKVTVDVYQYQDVPAPTSDQIVVNQAEVLNGTDLKVSWLSNHGGGQTRMVTTENGVYFGLFTGEDADAPTVGINLLHLKGDGTSENLYSSSMISNGSGPMISVMADTAGNIYMFSGFGEDPEPGTSQFRFSLTMWVYDPVTGVTEEYQTSQPYAMGDTRSYGGGGYATTSIDEKNGRILAVVNAGNKPGDMEWAYFDLNTRTWSTLKYASLKYRYCYTFMLPDGQGGFHVFNQRDVQVTAVKTDYGKNVELTSRATHTNWYDNNMLFDEWDYFHIPDPTQDGISVQFAVEEAVYNWEKGLYPDFRADSADIFMDSQGYLHFLYNARESITYGERITHVVYRVNADLSLEEVHRQTLPFAASTNHSYYCRMFEDTTGAFYIVGFRDTSTPLEIEIFGSSDPTTDVKLLWAEADTSHPGLQVAGTAVATSRNGSRMTDVMSLGLYSYEIKWYYFTVDFAQLRAFLNR